jgi:hypothetical protein
MVCVGLTGVSSVASYRRDGESRCWHGLRMRSRLRGTGSVRTDLVAQCSKQVFCANRLVEH